MIAAQLVSSDSGAWYLLWTAVPGGVLFAGWSMTRRYRKQGAQR